MKTLCPICKKEYSYINSRHAKNHNTTIEELKKLDPNIRTSPTQGMRFTDETRKKMSIKSDKYYESISKQDRSGVNNSFYGKKHSIESKAKIGRDIHGENNPFYGKRHRIESKNKMSNTRASKMSTGEIQSWHHNNGTHISIKSNNEESYDSKLELFRMIQMDNDPYIIKWTKNHNIKIEYKIDNIIKNYVPDFIVEYTDGSIYIEEVKGWDINANSKFDALVQYCKTSKFKYKWHQQDASIFSNYRKWLKTLK